MSAGQDAYNRSRYEQARRDLRDEIRAEMHQEFEATAPVKLIELAERFVIAVEAIARAKGVVALPVDLVKTGTEAFERGLNSKRKD